MNLQSTAYKDFGLWNALEFVDEGGGLISLKAHPGDFFPETPEDYLRVLSNETENDFPVRADIDITNICNHKCPFCFSQFDRAKNPKLSMEPIIFYQTVSELVSNGTKSIRFCGGGEPLAHPKAFELMSYTLKKPVHVTLLTNGDLFTDNFQNIFLREFVNIRFSIDSFNSASRVSMHGTNKGSFKRVIENINLYNEKRLKLGLFDTTQTGTTYLLHTENASDLFNITRLIKSTGVNYIAFRRILGKKFAVPFATETENEIRDKLEFIKQSFEDDTFKVFITNESLVDSGKMPIKFFDKCLVSRVRVIIEADGSVQMCPRARGEKSWRTLGTITADNTFMKVWKSGVRKNQQKLAPNACDDCIDISSNNTLVQITRFSEYNKIVLKRAKY